MSLERDFDAETYYWHQGALWRVACLIDQPALILDRINGGERETVVIGSPNAEGWRRVRNSDAESHAKSA